MKNLEKSFNYLAIAFVLLGIAHNIPLLINIAAGVFLASAYFFYQTINVQLDEK